jgi:hypothetical protein
VRLFCFFAFLAVERQFRFPRGVLGDVPVLHGFGEEFPHDHERDARGLLTFAGIGYPIEHIDFGKQKASEIWVYFSTPGRA